MLHPQVRSHRCVVTGVLSQVFSHKVCSHKVCSHKVCSHKCDSKEFLRVYTWAATAMLKPCWYFCCVWSSVLSCLPACLSVYLTVSVPLFVCLPKTSVLLCRQHQYPASSDTTPAIAVHPNRCCCHKVASTQQHLVPIFSPCMLCLPQSITSS